MNKRYKFDLPGIVYIAAILVGVLLFLIFGEPLLGVKPNLIWIAWIIVFLVGLAAVWVWNQTRKR